jgi:hypothetical protein
MGAAERIEEVDAFEAPRVQLACMEKRLSSPAMMKAEHGEIESSSCPKTRSAALRGLAPIVAQYAAEAFVAVGSLPCLSAREAAG